MSIYDLMQENNKNNAISKIIGRQRPKGVLGYKRDGGGGGGVRQSLIFCTGNSIRIMLSDLAGTLA